jgi:hypothetical protein
MRTGSDVEPWLKVGSFWEWDRLRISIETRAEPEECMKARLTAPESSSPAVPATMESTFQHPGQPPMPMASLAFLVRLSFLLAAFSLARMSLRASAASPRISGKAVTVELESSLPEPDESSERAFPFPSVLEDATQSLSSSSELIPYEPVSTCRVVSSIFFRSPWLLSKTISFLSSALDEALWRGLVTDEEAAEEKRKEEEGCRLLSEAETEPREERVE